MKLRYAEHARGATCPKCGHAFKRGFSEAVVQYAPGPSRPLTVCTGCHAILELRNGSLEALSSVELRMLSDVERAALAQMGRLINFAQSVFGRPQ